ncbi:anhydro-N-acetylmuramic acid kinase [Streptomyces sulphureus]|uniref:anhydro-N-acetylmuramic acid kinase n=1 Tax=Streptomyces sulphureus TaxID=47758 RepID=UPI00039F26C1|nr:anhydro-N-acetylmuramic acid kinase [Streptomyces sulphureus]
MRVIGLMSGTSCDAVEAAAADLEPEQGTLRLRPLGSLSAPYPPRLRRCLDACLPPGGTTLAEVCALDTEIGRAFADLAARADRELCGDRAELAVSHGQTVYHWTHGERALGTLQLGQPAWIAEATGLPVVSDLRPRDIAAGGQGAPLVGLFDVLWLRGREGTPAALNIGGIANATLVPCSSPEEKPPSAFDTGPGNALIDAAVRHLTSGAREFDEGGALAARGTVHPGLLRHLLDDPYYALPAPKTTGREHFHPAYLQRALAASGAGELAAEDLVATVTRLTARTAADAVRTAGATEVLASGGGTRNPALMAALAEELGRTPLHTSQKLGMPMDDKEAYAFAVLGWLTVHGLAATAPTLTGARHPSILGSLTPGRDGFRLPPPAAAPTRLRIEQPAG